MRSKAPRTREYYSEYFCDLLDRQSQLKNMRRSSYTVRTVCDVVMLLLFGLFGAWTYYESIVYVSVYKREMHQLSVSPRLVKVASLW